MVRKCLLLSQRNNKCKNGIKMKNVNVHHYLFLSETYEPVARDTITLHKKEYMSLYNLVTDNFKEYDFDTEYCFNIYITSLLCFFQKKIIEYINNNRYTYSMNGIINS
jgi:hypothetical protein